MLRLNVQARKHAVRTRREIQQSRMRRRHARPRVSCAGFRMLIGTAMHCARHRNRFAVVAWLRARGAVDVAYGQARCEACRRQSPLRPSRL